AVPLLGLSTRHPSIHEMRAIQLVDSSFRAPHLPDEAENKKGPPPQSGSKAISGASNRYLLCKRAMLAVRLVALAIKIDTLGFELPIRKSWKPSNVDCGRALERLKAFRCACR